MSAGYSAGGRDDRPRRSRAGRRGGDRGTDRPGGRPASARELRAQGRRTAQRLLDAGMRVFAERGYHAARVDDVVRAARTSHGTFYLYFENKDDLLRELAAECAAAVDSLADGLGPIGPDAEGRAELRRFLGDFADVYERFGPVIRAWMEDHVDDREVNRLGVRAFTRIGTELGRRARAAGAEDDPARVAALMAMLERVNYFLVSRSLGFDRDAVLDTLTTTVHRGFFGAGLEDTAPRR